MGKRAMWDMTSGSPMRSILGFLIPMLFGLLFQQFYSMMGTITVGKYLGISALASAGPIGSVNFMIIGFCMGVRSGFAIPVVQKLGEKNESAMRKFVANSGWLAAAFAAVMTVAMCILYRQILARMRIPKDIIDGAYSYIFATFMGIPAIHLYNLLSGIIRSLGDNTTPAIFLLVSSVINIILGLFTIIVLKMGVVGATWATVTSQVVSGILCLPYMRKKSIILKMQGEGWKPDVYAMRTFRGMGIPMRLQYSITAIGSAILRTAVNSFGSVATAPVTVGSKTSMFFYCPFDAMGATMATHGGQNVGAKRLDRAHQGMKSCIILGAAYSALALVVLYFFSDVVALLFTDVGELEILRNTRQFLMTNVAFYFLLALVNTVRSMIQGLGYSKFVIITDVYGMGVRCTVAFLISWSGYNAVCFADPLTQIAADIFLIPAYLYVMKYLRRKFGQIEMHPVTGASVMAAKTGCR